MPLNTIINLSQKREKIDVPIDIAKSFSLDIDTFISLKEVNKSFHDINLNLNIYKYIKNHEVDYELVNVINNQFSNIIKLNISDYKGLSNQGMKEMAMENLWDGICEAFVRMWEYIRDALTGLLNAIKNFFSSKGDERSAKIADRLTKVFQDSSEYGLDDIPLSNIPEQQELKVRIQFYNNILKTIEKLYNETKSNTFPPESREIFETIEKELSAIDKDKKSGIVIDIKSNKININKLNLHSGYVKDFKWIVESEEKIDEVQKSFLDLKKKYEDLQKTIQDILSVSKLQIANLKVKNMSADEKYLHNAVISYGVLINIITNVLPAFIKDSLIINSVCEQMVKGIENHKDIKAGYENKTKVF